MSRMSCPGVPWRFRLLLALLLGALAAGASTQAADTAVFCAYNVRNWLLMERFDGKAVVQNAAKSGQEKQAVIQTLAAIRPDILGLSEIGNAGDLAEIQAMLKAAGFDLPHSEVAQGGDPTRRLGLLSRFPIASRQSQEKLQYDLDGRIMPVQRGILDVTLSLREDFQLRCLGVHFKSKREVGDGDQALMRRNEAELLRRHIDDILERNPDTRLLAYGDFNEYRNEAAIRAVQGSRTGLTFMEDLRPADSEGEVWTHFWTAADLYSRIDYLFVNRVLKPFVMKEGTYIHRTPDFETASDHRPVVTTLRLPAVAGKQSSPPGR